MNSFIKYHLWVILSIVSVIIHGCGTGPDNSRSGQWQQAGLEKMSVNKLDPFEENIYATTDSGLHRMEKTTKDWTSLGLVEEEVLDIAFLPDNKWLVAICISDFSSGIPSLYLSSDDGRSWQPYMSNYGGENGEYTWVEALTTVTKPSDTVFAGGGLARARSLDEGKSWQLFGPQRWDLWGGSLDLLKTIPHHKGHIWAGGHNSISWPYLSRSTDGGDSWEGLKVVEQGVEATVRDVWVAPEDTTTILITTGGIQRSTDGGDHWESVFTQTPISTFAHSARDPAVVYASGEYSDGTLFFATSEDFGESWETIEWEDSPAGIQVNDMISVMEGGKEVLYFGTNQGIFSYRFKE